MKQRVIILLLGICMITTLVVSCGNSKNKETEKENVNESEVVTEVGSELGTEIESELSETEVETKATESQDTTSSEQKENKPSSDKGQSGSGSANNKPQKGVSSSSSANTWTDGEGNVLSTDPALCSHGGMSRCRPKDACVTEERNIVKYDTGAYDYELWAVYPYTTCTWCNANMGAFEEFGRNATNYDNLTDYAGEFNRTGLICSQTSIDSINEKRVANGLEPFTYEVPVGVDKCGGILVKYDLSHATVYDTSSSDYTMLMSYGIAPTPADLYTKYNYSKICIIAWGASDAYILFN